MNTGASILNVATVNSDKSQRFYYSADKWIFSDSKLINLCSNFFSVFFLVFLFQPKQNNQQQ